MKRNFLCQPVLILEVAKEWRNLLFLREREEGLLLEKSLFFIHPCRQKVFSTFFLFQSSNHFDRTTRWVGADCWTVKNWIDFEGFSDADEFWTDLVYLRGQSDIIYKLFGSRFCSCPLARLGLNSMVRKKRNPIHLICDVFSDILWTIPREEKFSFSDSLFIG